MRREDFRSSESRNESERVGEAGCRASERIAEADFRASERQTSGLTDFGESERVGEMGEAGCRASERIAEADLRASERQTNGLADFGESERVGEMDFRTFEGDGEADSRSSVSRRESGRN